MMRFFAVRLALGLVPSLACLAADPGPRTGLPPDWKFSQEFHVGAPGLVEVPLPPPTLDAAQPHLEDLRVLDSADREVPFLVRRSTPSPQLLRDARSFQVTLTPAATVIQLTTGLDQQPIDALQLSTPAPLFIKAADVEGSTNQQRWDLLAKGAPLFRQAEGPSQLQVPLPLGLWPFLRVTINDEQSAPVPFSGAKVRTASVDPPTEPMKISVLERTEGAGETVLEARLPGAHLQLARVRLETDESLFTREVQVQCRRNSEGALAILPLGTGVVYRLALPGQVVSSNLTVAVEAPVPTRDLLILIRNNDSPPLRVTGLIAEVRPVSLVLLPPQPGTYRLLCGNSHAAPPQYDVAGLNQFLQTSRTTSIPLSGLLNNPAFRERELLPAAQNMAKALDVSGWKYRKAIKVDSLSVQELELDLDVLAHARPGLEDLRLISEGNQLPYLLERTAVTRTLELKLRPAEDARTPRQSRWSVQLPLANLPIVTLRCASPTALFERQFRLFEEAKDERGDTYDRTLAQASWVHTPDHQTNDLVVALPNHPSSDTLYLATDNGENPPIQLSRVQANYHVSRLLFKPLVTNGLYLYYGQADVPAPQYDVHLIAAALRSASRSQASAGPEELMKKPSWSDAAPGSGIPSVLFWTVLVLVVAGLLVVIVRLLPPSARKS